MPHHLAFNKRHNYEDDLEQAIFVPVGLSANGIYVDVAAKLDTGAEYCLFDRKWASEEQMKRGTPSRFLQPQRLSPTVSICTSVFVPAA
jgi:hypothetical protein